MDLSRQVAAFMQTGNRASSRFTQSLERRQVSSLKDKKKVFPSRLKKVAQPNYKGWIKVNSARNAGKYQKQGLWERGRDLCGEYGWKSLE